MAAVIYAVVSGSLKPSVEAVEERQSGAIRLDAGTNFGNVVEAIAGEARLPPGSVFRFLGYNSIAKRPAWVSVPKWCITEPGTSYYFKVAPPKLARRKRKRARGPAANWSELLHFDLLHRNLKAIKEMLQLNVDAIDEYAFQRFISQRFGFFKGLVSTLVDCTRINFEDRYGICLSFRGKEGFDTGKLLHTKAGIAVDGASFSCFVAILNLQLFESGKLPCDENNRESLREVAFLTWISCLLRIKHRDIGLRPGQIVTFSKDLKAGIVEEVGRSMPSAAFSASDVTRPHRQLIIKVGHSHETHDLVHELGVESRLWHQVQNETTILGTLKSCHLVPPMALSCRWNGMLVVATEKQGAPLLNKDFSTSVDLSTQADALFRDLTTMVLHLERHGIAQGDIKPTNVGVYFRPEEHDNRRFYLYDFGLALELPQGDDKPGAGSLYFSSCETLKEGKVDLLTELVAVVYTCLDLLGVVLPWYQAAERGELWACIDSRRDFAEAVTKDSSKGTTLAMLSPATRSWVVHVLAAEHPTAEEPSEDEIREAARFFLPSHLKLQSCPDFF